MRKALWQISLSIPESAEEIISVVFEKIFGRPPSFYTDANTHKTVASIFLNKASQWNPSVNKQLLDDLKTIRQIGIPIGAGKILVKRLKRENWAESWKKHFKPIEIGKTLLIKPSWSKRSPLKNQACVVLDPGLSFGTGQHATTLFCLKQIVYCRKSGEKQSFLDIGTGSGILAISAAKLGYQPVRAFDFDKEAVRVSRKNAAQNGIADKVSPAFGDLTKLPSHSKTKFDVICANLMYDLLLAERRKITNRLAPGGSLILAGILKTQFAKVQEAYEKMGMNLTDSGSGKEWRSGRFIFGK